MSVPTLSLPYGDARLHLTDSQWADLDINVGNACCSPMNYDLLPELVQDTLGHLISYIDGIDVSF